MLICFFSVCVIDAVSATHLAITWHQFLEEEALSNVIVPRPQDLLVWYIRCVLHPKYAFQQPYPLHAFQKKKILHLPQSEVPFHRHIPQPVLDLLASSVLYFRRSAAGRAQRLPSRGRLFHSVRSARPLAFASGIIHSL